MSDNPETSETKLPEPEEISESLSAKGEASMQGNDDLSENPYDPSDFDASQISSGDVQYFGECRRISNLPEEEQWSEWEKLTGAMNSKDMSARGAYLGVDGKGVNVYPPWGRDVFRIHRSDSSN